MFYPLYIVLILILHAATRAEELENEASQENEHTDVAVNDEEQQETTEENDEEDTENYKSICKR